LRQIPQELEGFPSWRKLPGNGDRYQSLVDGITELRAVLAPLGENGDARKAFLQAKTALEERHRLLASLRQGTWSTHEEPIPCGYPVFKHRETAIEISRTERFSADGKKKTEKRQLAKVVCPSAISVSWGITGADIKRQTFGYVDSLPDPEPMPQDGESGGGGDPGSNGEGDGEPALIKRFSAETTSDPLISPVGLINTRLWNWQWCGGRLAGGLHLSAGAALDLDSPDSGVTLGYVVGLTFSFQDRYYLTAGWTTHKVETLAGGFALGDPVPDGLTEPPTETSWADGFSLSVTFRPGKN
jgi:hypothetical protein